MSPNLRNQGIVQTMSHCRFSQVWKFFKVADPDDLAARLKKGDPGYDPKFWYRPFYEAVQEALIRNFVAGGYCVMDEYMQASAHRIHYQRVMLGKPNDHGLLWYIMAGVKDFFDESGKQITGATLYIPLRFDLYTADEPWRRVPGARGGRGKPPPEYRGYGEGGCFLVRFIAVLMWNGVIKRGTTIIGDRLFTSVKLLRHLGNLGLNYIGTAKKKL